MPSFGAAPDRPAITRWDSFKARRMCSRSRSLRVLTSAAVPLTGFAKEHLERRALRQNDTALDEVVICAALSFGNAIG